MPESRPGEGPGTSAGEAPEITGRDRLVAALKRPGSRGQLTAAVLLALLGFAAVVQVQANDKDDTFVGASQEDLIQLINSQSLATDRIEADIADLELARDSLRNDAAASQTALGLARAQVDSLGILAGTIPAVGPGIEVTVDGPAASIGTEQLLNGLQELRDAGAEAMEINGAVRVVAQTSISDGSGDSVLIDGKQFEPPFVIKVIGNKVDLKVAVFFPQGFADSIADVNGEVTVKQLDRVEITTTRSLPSSEFAEPQD